MMTTAAPSFEQMRHSMVASQLRTNAVNDPRVVTAMTRVPREAFLPETARTFAYRDGLLPLVAGRRHNSPLATGRLLTEAKVQRTDHVLLVGAAGGYAAALLAELAGSVVALEEQDELVATAKRALAEFGNVQVVQGPLAQGWAERAPYDLLMIDGAVEHVPEVLLDQLKPGARVVSGIVETGITRLAVGVKTEGGFGMLDFADCECTLLPGFARPKTFAF